MQSIHITFPNGETRIVPEPEGRSLWQKGQIPAGSLYWMEGMADWKPVTEFFGLRNPAAALDQKTYRRDPRGLTKFVVIMLWMFLGMEVVSILSDVGMLMLLSRDYTLAEAEANDLRQGLVAIVYMVMYLVTAIGFLRWVHRAAFNSRGFGAVGMSNSPGWSVGWYFVPIASLFKPYEAMKEIWQVSRNPRAWRTQPVPGLLRWWWGLWLTSNLLAQIVFRYPGDTVDDLQVSTQFSILSSLVGIPLTLVALRVITSIAANQEAWVNAPPETNAEGGDER